MMNSKRRLQAGFVVLSCLTLVAGWLMLSGERSGSAAQLPVKALEPATPTAAADDRQSDRTALKRAIDSFVAAFKKGDGKTIAAQWTTEGEYIGDDGVTIRGRAALEKEYVEFFKKNSGNSLEIEVELIRFPSKDTAVVEGHFKLRKPKGELIVSRCSFLYVREEEKWLIAIAREWPGDGLTLRDLEWLIGNWEAKRDGAVVMTKYDWTANKSFIRCQFSVTRDGQTQTGMQMIGKDPSTGALHIWTFEDNGGIGDADITRDGKKWKHAATGVTSDGRVLAATNIMTPVDADTFLFQSVERSMDNESLADLPPIKVVRVKSKR